MVWHLGLSWPSLRRVTIMVYAFLRNKGMDPVVSIYIGVVHSLIPYQSHESHEQASYLKRTPA